MFVDTFIRRPILAGVCSFAIVLFGLIALPTLPIAQFPQLTPPQVTVSTVYTGASAEVVETTVTQPLEEALNGVEGMVYMTSTSSNNGTSQITVTFDITRDVDLAAVDVQNRVSQVEARLPSEVRQLGVTVQKGSSGFVFGAGVWAEDARYDRLFLSNYLDVFVKDALKRVPGVADVFIFGERRYSMRIWLDPDRLAVRRLTADDVVAALAEQNVQVAAGQVGQPPMSEGQTYQFSVRAIGRLSDPAEFEDIVLKRGDGADLVRLGDVARVELGAQTYAADLRFDNREALGFAIMQLPDANALEVYSRATAELERLAERFPPGMRYEVAFDTTTVVSESIREVVKTLGGAVLLVMLVLFLFLHDWRATVIPGITIPVSLVGTLAFLKLFDFSINTLTLFGITLAVGIVVDDTIVVVENIQRHVREQGTTAREVAARAMHEVVGPVIATTLVLWAVFVPVAMFPGTTGRLYQQFAITIATSVALSTFVALTLAPALSALLLRPERLPGRFFHAVEQGIRGGRRAYVGALGRGMRFRWLIAVVFVGGLLVTTWMYRSMPRAFVPDEDPGYIMITVQAPDGASLDYTSRAIAKAVDVLHETPEVARVFSVAGFSFLGSGANRGMMFVGLTDFDERRGEERSATAVVNRLYGQLAGIAEAIVVPFLPPPIFGLGTFGGIQFELLDQSGGDIGEFARVAQEFSAEANQAAELTGLFTGFTASDPQLSVTIERERAKALGLSFASITETLQVLMGSLYVNDFDFNNRSYRVYVQADERFRRRPQDIGRYYVRTPDGQMVRLDALVHVEERTAPQVIHHYNLFRSAEIHGRAAPGFSTGQAIQRMEQLARERLPAGMTFEWAGLSREEIESGGQAVFIFALGLLFVYLALAAQYESLALPFIIMLSVPLAVLGGLGAQWARGLVNDVYCQIGTVVLIGLAAKNGILIVEFAERLRARGLAVVEAAIEAARIRLRPILMTSLTLIVGVMPLALASGAGRAARHSVGTTVLGGMLLSTLLNLVFVPVFYVIVRTILPGQPRRTPARSAG